MDGYWNTHAPSCLPFTPPQRFSGLWVIGFETSQFFPNAKSLPKDFRTREQTALNFSQTFKESAASKQIVALSKDDTHEIWVDMIARRSICNFGYGRGLWEHEVLVEQFIRAREVRRYRF